MMAIVYGLLVILFGLALYGQFRGTLGPTLDALAK